MDDFAVGVYLAASAEIAHQVPMYRRDVLAASLGVRRSDCEMARAADLLIEQRIACVARNSVVVADRHLAQKPRAWVRIQNRDQIVLTARRSCTYDLAMFEPKTGIFDRVPAANSREAEPNVAVGAGLDGAREYFPGWEVALAVAVHPFAARYAQREVGVSRDDAQRARRRQPVNLLLLLDRECSPLCDGVVAIQEHGCVDKVGIVGERHSSFLCEGVRWVQRAGPARLASRG